MGTVRIKFNLVLTPKAVVPHSSLYQNHLEGLLNHRWLNPTLRVSDSVNLGWGSRIDISAQSVWLNS